MGSRARLVALLVIAAYGLFCFYYYSFYVAPKAHGVILFLAPGLTLDALGRARAQAGQEGLLVMRARQTALVHNGSLDDIPADSLYTMLATSASPGADPAKIPPSLLYLAERRGRLTGLITSTRLTDPAPAAFYMGQFHLPPRPQLAAHLGNLLQGRNIDFVAGAGGEDFRLAGPSTRRAALERAGYYYADSAAALEDAPTWLTRQFVGTFGYLQLPWHSAGSPLAEPSLADIVRRAIQHLQFNLNGYFLVVHHGLIETAASRAGPATQYAEITALNEAIDAARSYAGENSIILLYAPYERAPEEDDPSGAGFGWTAALSRNELDLNGFITPADLHRLLAREL